MNPIAKHVSAFAAGVLILLAKPVGAETITANFTSPASVPVTATNFTADGKSLVISLNCALPAGTDLTVVNNLGTGFINGRFTNLAQGQTVTLTYQNISYQLVANYFGGTGNDLTLQWAAKRIYAWGGNASGSFGTGDTIGSGVPVAVPSAGAIAGKTILTIAKGAEHTLALCADGTLAAWGNNSSGQLGDGTTNNRYLPTAVTGSGILAGKSVIAIAAGTSHSIALCADGTLACWGAGFGNVPATVATNGVLAGKSITAIAAGGDFSLALCADGTVAAWGNNASGQLGNGTTTSSPTAPVAVLTAGVLAGKVVIAVSAGAGHCLALCSDGTLAAWGANTYGALGNGTCSNSAAPVAVVTNSGTLAGKTITGIAAGIDSSLACCLDGTLATWGYNGAGQLGNGSFTDRNVPVPVIKTLALAGRSITAISADRCDLALCADGSIASWGDNLYGQLGDNLTYVSTLPGNVSTNMLAAGEKFTVLAAGSTARHAIALAAIPLSDNSRLATLAITPNTLEPAFSPDINNFVMRVPHGTAAVNVTPTAADPAAGITVNGLTATSGAPVQVNIPSGNRTITINVTAANGTTTSYVIAVKDDSWLAGLTVSDGTLMPGFAPSTKTYDVCVAAPLTAMRVTPVAADTAATIKVNGATVASGSASQPVGLDVGTNIIDVTVTGPDGTATTYRIAVLRPGPVVFTYNSADDVAIDTPGYDAAGNTVALSLGFAPELGSSLTVIKRGGGDLHHDRFANLAQGQTINLLYQNVNYGFVANYYGGSGNDLVLQWAMTKLYSWGANGSGQLGNGGTTLSRVPLAVASAGVLAGKTVIAVANGNAHTLALCADGTLAAWGDNTYGQLGNGTTNTSKVPIAVTNSGALAGKTVIVIAAGSSHSLALCDDGSMAAWGSNSSGQLGTGTVYASTVPVAVNTHVGLAGKSITAIAAGSVHNIALCADGTLATWGDNGNGQLGNGTTTSGLVPLPITTSGVLTGKTVTAIAAGTSHSLALCSDGTIASWGINDTALPVAVSSSADYLSRGFANIAEGSSHHLALLADGTVLAWGDNTYGQLGGATNGTPMAPVTSSGVLFGRNVTAVVAGNQHSFALCSDGVLAAWGYDSDGELGNGSIYTSSSTPAAVSTATMNTGEKFLNLAEGLANHATAIVAVPLSHDSGLAAITFDPGMLETPLAAGTTTYTARVPHGTHSISVRPQASDANARLTVNGIAVASGVASPSIALSAGNMTVTIQVTSQDGTNVTSYVITVRDDATLAGLALSAGTFQPAFSPDQHSYGTYVSTATAAVTLTPATTDPSASITVNGTAAPSGSACAPVSLAPGANTITVRVTAIDGTALDYQIIVNRQSPLNYTYNSAGAVAVTATDFTATGMAANLTLNFAPDPGTPLTVVNNTGTAMIHGTFDNLAQGQLVSLMFGGVTYQFVCNYFGGTGNDIVLEWAYTRLLACGGASSNYGQLGNNSTSNTSIAVPVDMSGVLAGKTILRTATGSSHSLALCADGTLAAWGYNADHELGNAGTSNSYTPVLVDQSGVLAGKSVVAIAAGAFHNLALCTDGTLAAWGRNSSGQLGNGVTLSSGGSQAVLVDTSGALVGKRVIAVAAGGFHSLALCEDGTLVAWGSNAFGQLGNNATINSNVPVRVDLTGVLAGKTVTAIAAGGNHSLALCADGTLAAWGYNNDGELGNNSQTNSSVPVAVQATGVLAGKTPISIMGGFSHSLALCADGSLSAWGYNNSGQLGNNSTTASAIPVAVVQTGVLASKTVTAISSGSSHCLALCADGSPAAWGYNSCGQLGNNSTTNSSVPVLSVTTMLTASERITRLVSGSSSFHDLITVAMPPPPRATTVAASGIHDADATLNANVNAQGGSTAVSFDYGQTASYGASVAATPSPITGTATSSPAATSTPLVPGTTYHFRVVATNSSGTVRGDDMTFTTSTHATITGLSLSAGILTPALTSTITRYAAAVPSATTSVTVTPVCPFPDTLLAVNGVTVASGSASQAISLIQGDNAVTVTTSGDAGTDTRSYTLTITRLPQTFTYNSVTDTPVTVGDFTATGLTANFSLNCMPVPGVNLTVIRNTGLRPIQGTFANLTQWQPVQLSYGGITYDYVANYSGGTGNDLVLQWASNRIMDWGENSSGQLGNGATANSSLPVSVDMSGVLAGKTIASACCGYAHALALCTDNTLAAWGANSSAQLGNNTTNNSYRPVAVDQSGVLAGRKIIAIACGGSYNLVLCEDGTLAAWGANASGQLGNGRTTQSGVPVRVDQTGVLAGKSVIAIACGNATSLALCGDGTLAAWGSNTYGTIGDNTTNMSSVPVLVNANGVLAGRTVVAISSGYSHNLALCSDGTLAAWGYNSNGQLGNNSTTQSNTPVPVDQTGALAGKTVVAIAAGYYQNQALCSDGTLTAWGNNLNGQLGNNSTTQSNAPVPVTQTGVLAGKTITGVAGGGNHNLALCADGTLAAWGYNYYGGLGNNTTTNSSIPVLVATTGLGSSERFVSAAAGYTYSLAVVATPPPPAVATLAATGILDTGATLTASANARGYATNVSFEYGTTTAYGSIISATPAAVGGSATTTVTALPASLNPGTTYHYRIAATNSQGGQSKGADMVLTTSSLATLSGLNSSAGTLNPAWSPGNTKYFATVPAAVTGVTMTPVAATPNATIIVNGTAVASGSASQAISLATGNNAITITVITPDGINQVTYSLSIVRLPQQFAYNSAADVPVTTSDFTAAGQTASIMLNYVPVPGTTLTMVNNTGSNPIAGWFANLAQGQIVNLTYNGVTYAFVANYYGGTGNDLVLQWAATRLLAWGDNYSGQLGNNSTIPSNVPVPVTQTSVLAGKTITGVAGGGNHSLALCADGSLAAWGANGSGQLGNNSVISSSTPVAVNQTGTLAGKTIVKITAGYTHSLALCTDGTMAAWGNNAYGQLGNGSFSDSAVPIGTSLSGALAGKTVIAIDAGEYDSLALCADGTLAAWGANNYGQLGNASTVNSALPVRVSATGALAGKTVTAIAAGNSNCLALCSDGTLAAWGYNNYGQLGNGSTTDSSVPVPVTQSGVLAGKTITAISAGYNHSMALCSDGTLAVWGYVYYGQLGNNGTTNSSVPVLVTQTGVLAGKTITGIAAGGAHGLALCADGFAAAWGSDSSGQLGDNSTTSSSVPVAVNTSALRTDERMAAMFGGDQHSLAVVASPPLPVALTVSAINVLDTAGTLIGNVNAMGSNTAVSFDYGPTTAYGSTIAASPPTVSGTSVTPVAATVAGLLSSTGYHYRIVATNGGGTVRGQDMTFSTSGFASLSGITLSGGSLAPSFDQRITHYLATVPNATSALTATPVTAAPSAAVTINGTAVASGSPSAPISLVVGETLITISVTAADGINSQTYIIKVVRLPQSFAYNSAFDVPLTVSAIAAGGAMPPVTLNFAPAAGTRLMVIRNTGTDPIQGAFADLSQNQVVAVTYGGIAYDFVANYHGGTGNDLVLEWANVRLLAWGNNYDGRLGNRTTTNSGVPVVVDMTGALAGKTLVATATGGSHVVALASDGSLAAWGNNTYGQLGNNSTTQSGSPTPVDQTGALSGKTVIAVAAGTSHSLALCSDGTLAAWGYNNYGQLGDNTTSTRLAPVLVNQSGVLDGKTITAIAAGDSHSLALCSDGTLAAWGYNNSGQLGDNTTTNNSSPVAVVQTGVLAGKTVAVIAAGGNNSLALCSNGILASWGMNGTGQLGNNGSTNSSVPVLVTQSGALSGKTVTAIAVGALHSMALCSDGTLTSWGYNYYGALGINSTTNKFVPTLVYTTGVLAGKTVTAIAAGTNLGMALCADGSLTAWGDNTYGQLGNNSTTQSNVPVLTTTSMLGSGERVTSIQGGNGFGLAAVASSSPPIPTTIAASAITDTTATLNGSVNANGITTGVRFDCGLTTAYGSTIIATPTGVGGTTPVTATAGISGLLAGTTYHFRVVGLRAGYTTYGADLTFTTNARAVLAGLATSAGTLTPAFAGNTNSYLLSVPYPVATLALTPTAATPGAVIAVNGTPVTSGSASAPLDLAVGDNAVAVAVSSADGSDQRTYNLKVARLPQSFAFNSAADVPLTVSDLGAVGTSVSVGLGFAPVPGATLMMVRNTGPNRIQGTFANLTQGQNVNMVYGGVTYAFVANYFGGNGNDLVLQWANNRLLAWGYNGYGNLGNNSTTNSSTMVPVDMSGVLAGKPVTAVACGWGHSLALCSDGTLAGWGYNNYGQLGNNSVIISAPVRLDNTGVLAGKLVVAIACGYSHSLALCSDGTLAAWGYNYSGQLGNNSTVSSNLPVLVDQTGVLAGKSVISIACGDYHNLVLCSDGTLAAWGYDFTGQLGNNINSTSYLTPVLVDRTGVLAGKSVTAISAAGSYCLAMCSDGTIAAWGSNTYGQLGNNGGSDSKVPVLVNRSGVFAGRTPLSVSAGAGHSLALCTDGFLAAWGSNTYGQLGDLNTISRSVPFEVIRSGMLFGTTVTSVTAGNNCSFALCSDGTLAAWGYNSNGQLGTGDKVNTTVPVWANASALANGEQIAALKAGSAHTLALVASPPGPLATTLAATEINEHGARLNGSVIAQGDSVTVSFEYGLTSSYGTVIAATPATVAGSTATAITAVTAGLLPGTTYHFRIVATRTGGMARGEDMTFTTSANATLAGLAIGSGTLSPAFTRTNNTYLATVTDDTLSVTPTCTTPTATVKINGVSVASGSATPVNLQVGDNMISIVVTAADGITAMTYAVKTIRLPQSFTFNSATDVPLTASALAPAGNSVNCVLNFAPVPGTILTMVRNTGDLPLRGVFDNLPQWQRVELTYGNTTYVFVANYHGGDGNDLVLQWGNTHLLAWGAGTNGQLGNGISVQSSEPVLVNMGGVLAGKLVVAVAGGSHNLALCSDGTLASWGYNSNGQLGNSGSSSSSLPVLVNTAGVLAGRKVVAIAAGGYHSLAACSDGAVAAWGYNYYGQLGNNSTTDSNVPVLVDRTGVLAGKTVTTLGCGSNHSVALCDDGTLATWGYNQNGQLGNNSTANSGAPVLVDTSGVLAGRSISAVSVSSHCLALCSDGTLAGWGYNAYGELGNNSTTDSVIPVPVNRTGALAGKIIAGISAGGVHSLAVCSDGTVAAWGNNNYGQLGDNSTTNRTEPVMISQTGALAGKSVLAVSGGNNHSLALCADGSPAAWGYNFYGQLGNGNLVDSKTPVKPLVDMLLPGERFMTCTATNTSCVAITALPMPVATALPATSVTSVGATLNGTVAANGATAVISIEYGPTSSYGNTTAPVPATATGAGTTATSAALGGFAPGTTCHYRVVATCPGGVVRSADMTFTTLSPQPGDDDTDHDGIPNLVEYAFGLDPAAPNSQLQLPQPQKTADRWEIRFTAPAGVSGITYGAQWSATLQPGSWTDIADTGTGAEHVFSVPTIAVPKMFMRLKVSQP